ncbi:unnamed protein product [Brachionus calyciflorus]|uniref:Glutathione peroxidase n=1 Tax=Brachionus calyciflorus TaxID=104777 RepID=A0A813RA96_9BILA|nr:unnamed protein product [Brachionus calyciflorus]
MNPSETRDTYNNESDKKEKINIRVNQYPRWKFPKKKSFFENCDSLYNYSSLDIFKKNEVKFDRFRNDVVLVVNVASFCTYTLQYNDLNEIQSKYQKYGFHILGFPCNQFGHQEPGESGKEILNCLRYVRPGNDFKPNFQLLDKCDINGENESAFFKFLKSSCPPPVETYFKMTDLIYSPYKSNDVRWNFEKFLINKHGKVVMRFQHDAQPKEIVPFIEVLLNNGNLADLKKTAEILPINNN